MIDRFYAVIGYPATLQEALTLFEAYTINQIADFVAKPSDSLLDRLRLIIQIQNQASLCRNRKPKITD